MIRALISKLFSLYKSDFFIHGGGGSPSGYVIERSLRFMAASSQYLTRTFAGDGVKATHSFIIKRGKLGVQQSLFGWTNLSTITYGIAFTDGDALTFANVTGGAVNLQLVTNRLFRDCNAHYHIIVHHDTTQATASDRVKIFVNGERITSFSTATYPAQNAVLEFGTSRAWSIGINAGSAGHFDGYVSEHRVVLGQALDASSFGEINPATGQWVAKKYTGTYGTNGSYLDFKDGTSTTTLGQDKSGNGNNWTLTNFTRSAGVNDCWMKDVPAGNGSASAVQPSGNYAVLNPLDNSGGSTLSNSNLTFSRGAAHGLSARGTIALPTTGKWYFESVVTSNTSGASGVGIALVAGSSALSGGQGTLTSEYGMYGYAGSNTLTNNTTATTMFSGNIVAGTVLQIAADCDNNKIWVGIDNVWSDGTTTGTTGNPSTGTNPSLSASPAGLFPVGRAYANGSSVNFGQRSFAYTPPSGFKALCTANLPTPTIKKPSDHFKVQLSTGANIKTDSEALFTNELEWIKDRANANNHQLIDSVRGSNAVLQSNTTAAETTYTAPSGSSVGWVWRASDSAAVTNNDGSISSQVSANPTAGFSIVTFTGTGANATVGHGLGVAPKMVIEKCRNNLSGITVWPVYHSSIGNTSYLELSSTIAATTLSTVWNNTSPTSTTFAVGTVAGVNGSGNTFVAYCFAEIAGYSRFGSYTGNGSADGPFVHTGFKPRFVMIKRTDAVGNWIVFDTACNPVNAIDKFFIANTTAAEGTYTLGDVTSSGFKLRNNGPGNNDSGGAYIYMAFAETPFKYANAR